MDKIENTETTGEALSRRKALGRIGLIAAAAYTVPAFTTLSMAHASGSSEASDSSDSSDASDTSDSSDASDASAPSLSVPSAVEDICGKDGDLTSSEYVQCLLNNGVELPEGFILPSGVTVPQ